MVYFGIWYIIGIIVFYIDTIKSIKEPTDEVALLIWWTLVGTLLWAIWPLAVRDWIIEWL